MLVIRFEEDFCDKKLTSLHLSFTVKNDTHIYIYIFLFLLISPTLLGLWMKGRNMLLKAALGVMLNLFFWLEAS